MRNRGRKRPLWPAPLMGTSVEKVQHWGRILPAQNPLKKRFPIVCCSVSQTYLISGQFLCIIHWENYQEELMNCIIIMMITDSIHWYLHANTVLSTSYTLTCLIRRETCKVSIVTTSAFWSSKFHIGGFNQPWIENTQEKKFQKVPQKTWICCMSATISIAFTLHLQLFL